MVGFEERIATLDGQEQHNEANAAAKQHHGPTFWHVEMAGNATLLFPPTVRVAYTVLMLRPVAVAIANGMEPPLGAVPIIGHR